MNNKWIISTFGLAIAFLLICFLYWKSCNAPIKEFNTSKYDSTIKSQDSIAKQWEQRAGYFQDLAAFWQNRYDSVWNALSNSVSLVKERTDSIRSLISLYRKYKGENDTLRELVTCDELVANNDALLNLLDSAKIQLDALKLTSDSTIVNLRETVASLIHQIDALKSQVETLKAEVTDLIASNKKLARKEKFKDILAKAEGILLGVAVLFATFKK